MAVIGSDEWLSELVTAAAEVRTTQDASGSIAVTVEASPVGKIGWTETVEHGITVSATSPATKGADVVLTAKFAEFVAMLEGESNPAVMFMQGRLKLSGDMGLFLKLLPAMLTEEATAARAQLAAATDP